MLIGVVTGDIVSSYKMKDKSIWLNKLKEILNASPKGLLDRADQWDIFRGDSFQVRVTKPEKTLLLLLLIRAGLNAIPSFTALDMDVRMAIGIGTEDYASDSISESDGAAYRYSGQLLDQMVKEKVKIALHSPWQELDDEMRVSLALADALISGWSYKSAEIAWLALSGMTNQKALAKHLKISQPAVHKRLQRVYLEEITMLENRYQKQVRQYADEYGST